MDNFYGDIFLPTNLKLEEASGLAGGKSILGKISGPFFVPEGTSRNKRFYTKTLWENVLKRKDVQEKLELKNMFGTISHEQDIDDKALLEGKISHAVTSLKINESANGGLEGYGEAVIFNTPAGRILYTILEAGSQLYVSSRANGKYDGETKDGTPIVDEKAYDFKTFDFVLDPGFKQANPKLVESLMELLETETKSNDNNEDIKPDVNKLPTGEPDMPKDNELLESVVQENQSLKKDRDSAIDKADKLTTDLEAAQSELTKSTGKVEALTGQIGDLDQYKDLGTPAELKTSIEESTTLITAYKELGTPEEVAEAMEKAKGLLDSYKVLGTPQEVSDSLDKATEYIKNSQEQLENLGSFEEIAEAIEVSTERITSYKDLGTPEEIKEAFDKIDAHYDSIKEAKSEARIKELAKELKVDEEAVRDLYGKVDEEILKKTLSRITETAATRERTRRRQTNSVNEDNTDESENNNDGNSTFKKSTAKRLVEQFSN